MISVTSAEDCCKLVHQHLAADQYAAAIDLLDQNTLEYLFKYKSQKSEFRLIRLLAQRLFQKYQDIYIPNKFNSRDRTLFMQLVFHYQNCYDEVMLDQLWKIEQYQSNHAWFHKYLFNNEELFLEHYWKFGKWDQVQLNHLLFKLSPDRLRKLTELAIDQARDAWTVQSQIDLLTPITLEVNQYLVLLLRNLTKNPIPYAEKVCKILLPLCAKSLSRSGFETLLYRLVKTYNDAKANKQLIDSIISSYIRLYSNYYTRDYLNFIRIAAKLPPPYNRSLIAAVCNEYEKSYLYNDVSVIMSLTNLYERSLV